MSDGLDRSSADAYESLQGGEADAPFVGTGDEDGLAVNAIRKSLCHLKGFGLVVELGVCGRWHLVGMRCNRYQEGVGKRGAYAG